MGTVRLPIKHRRERFSFYISIKEENLQNSLLSVWHTADKALWEAFFFFFKFYHLTKVGLFPTDHNNSFSFMFNNNEVFNCACKLKMISVELI